jgi:hypothetical protein
MGARTHARNHAHYTHMPRTYTYAYISELDSAHEVLCGWRAFQPFEV